MSATEGGGRGAARTRSTPGSQGFVPEIQGLRTIALLLVVSFHIWFGRVSGGVDVFLLVSAYLMTRSLTARAETGAWTRPLEVTVRKLARLLPAAVAVVLLTLLAALFVTGPTGWRTLSGEALSAAGYTMNLHLQGAQADYFERSFERTSPFQHFWSLSIQGQVFLLWPLLHLAGEAFARGAGARVRAVLAVGFAGIGLASFAFALWLTGQDQPHAYFDTLARLWEFAAGSVLALLAPRLRLPRLLRALLGWLGLAGIVSCGFVLPVAASFPGWAALWPVASAALVLLSADRRGAGRPTNPLLASRPMRRIGGYSYALYLTHWPVLVFFGTLRGVERPGPAEGLGLVLFSALLAVLVTRLVERPVAAWLAAAPRRRAGQARPRLPRLRALLRPLAVVATTAALTIGCAIGVDQLGRMRVASVEADLATIDPARSGAMTIGHDAQQGVAPDPEYIYTSWASPGEPCPEEDPLSTKHCWTTGDPALAAVEGRNVLLIGSSHVLQIAPALEVVVQGRGDWAMRTYIAPDCSLQAEAWDAGRRRLGGGASPCQELWATAADYAAAYPPDLIVVLGTRQAPSGQGEEQPVPGLLPWLRDGAPAGARVAVVRDTPRFPEDPFECAVEAGFDAEECFMPAPAEADPRWIEDVEDLGAGWVDLTPAVCPEGVCPTSMGGLVTYFDDNHLTKYFTRSLAQELAEQLCEFTPWWPRRVWG